MAKININDLLDQTNFLGDLNLRFSQIEDELNNKVLYRTVPIGEPNNMGNDLDLSSNDILNVSTIFTNEISIGGVLFDLTGLKWGGISGTLSDQTDLQDKLDRALHFRDNEVISGEITDIATRANKFLAFDSIGRLIYSTGSTAGSANTISVQDSGNFFTDTNVEDVLQEVGASVVNNTNSIATNASNLSSVQADVATNTSDIAALQTAVSTSQELTMLDVPIEFFNKTEPGSFFGVTEVLDLATLLPILAPVDVKAVILTIGVSTNLFSNGTSGTGDHRVSLANTDGFTPPLANQPIHEKSFVRTSREGTESQVTVGQDITEVTIKVGATKRITISRSFFVGAIGFQASTVLRLVGYYV